MANNNEQIIGTNAITELLTDVRDWVMDKMPEVGPDAAGHDFVDLGLPSGTLWATMNVGASSPTDAGLYFSWGNTDGVAAEDAEQMTEDSYAGTAGAALTGDIAQGSANDAARVNLGGSWVMPTKAQFEELIDDRYTTTEWVTQDGINGRKITSKSNGKSIFLPAAGDVFDGALEDVGGGGNYWSTTFNSEDIACNLHFSSDFAGINNYERFYGYSVRGVLDAGETPSKLHKVAVTGDYNDLENKPNDYYKKSEVDEKLAETANSVSITWSELKTLRDGGNLVAGQWYRITDYATTTSQQDTQSAGHQFDIIVRADSPTVLNENAYAAKHEGDTYFQNAKLESWQLKYCLDNDTARFAWANTSTGKGVVYGMKDEFGNECGYDFKNILFKRYKVTSLSSNTSLQGLYAGYREINTSGSQGSLYPSGGTVSTSYTAWRYTFDLSGADYSLSPRQYGCHGNNIAPCKLQDTIANRERQWLNNITFGNTQGSSQCWGNKFLERCHSMSFGNECYANTFGQNCNYNTFGQNCYRNTFGQSCGSNTFGQNCNYNTFGQSCQYNTFGQYCRYNTFGQSCYGNTFGQNCYENTFGQNCYENTFGQSCGSNTFGQNCNYNTFGKNCYRNTFGQYCYYNTFGQSCCYNTFGQYCESNTFGQYCHYNSIDHAYPLDGEYGTNEVPDSVRHCKLISYEFNYEDGEEYGVTAWLCSPFDATVNLNMYVTDSEGGSITSYNQQVTLKANVPQYFETKGSSDNDPSVFHAEMSYEIAGKTVTLEGEYEW